jgi:hypothetical protein
MPNKNQNLKRDRFKNVAGRRVQKVLDNIDSLSKCANRSNYDYTASDVEIMVNAIKSKVKVLEAAYTSNTKSTKNTFKFH